LAVYIPLDRYDSDTIGSDDEGAGLGHVTNYAQNVDGTVWSLTQLEQHLGGWQSESVLLEGISTASRTDSSRSLTKTRAVISPLQALHCGRSCGHASSAMQRECLQPRCMTFKWSTQS